MSFKTGNDTVMQELLQRFQYSQNIETVSHRIVKISFPKPKPPRQTVTLWPVSHEMTFDMLKNLVKGNRWGKMLNFAYGRHKLFPQFHNAYLLLHIGNSGASPAGGQCPPPDFRFPPDFFLASHGIFLGGRSWCFWA